MESVFMVMSCVSCFHRYHPGERAHSTQGRPERSGE